jgi:hypothetical protein
MGRRGVTSYEEEREKRGRRSPALIRLRLKAGADGGGGNDRRAAGTDYRA